MCLYYFCKFMIREDEITLEEREVPVEIYRCGKKKEMIPLKRHDFDEDDLIYILKEIEQNKYKG